MDKVFTFRTTTWQRVALLGFLLVAFFLRVWQLDLMPPGLYYDEAMHGLDALRVWQGQLYFFFPNAGGHEPLFTYVVAGFVRVLGNNVWAIRLPSAFFGTLAIAACFALGRPLLGRGPALLASGLLAVTFWTVALSRLGYRANTLVVLFPLWLVAFWRCRGRTEVGPYLLAGLLLGLAQYTYLAARLLPLIALILAVHWRKELTWRWLVLGGALAAIVTVPLVIGILANPAVGGQRLRQAWVFNRPQPWALLWRQLQAHLLMFGWRGDPLWIHNLPLRSPVLWPLALLFWLSLYIGWRSPGARALLISLGVLIWSGILAVSNFPAPPDQLRVIALAPLVFLLVAYSLAWLTQRYSNWFAIAGLACILLDGGLSWRDYQHWGATRQSYEQLDADMTVIARDIVRFPGTYYIVPLSSDWNAFTPGHHSTIDYLSNFRQNYYTVVPPYALPKLQADRVGLITWLAGMHLSADPQHRLEGTLKLLGYDPVGSEDRTTYLVTYYARGQQKVQRFPFEQPHEFAEGFQISAVNLYLKQQPDGKKGQLIAEVQWASHGHYDHGLSLSLRLQTSKGETVAQVDSELWNDKGETADDWAAEEQSVLFLELDAADLPAGEYTVVLIPYATQSQAPLPSVAAEKDDQVGVLQLP